MYILAGPLDMLGFAALYSVSNEANGVLAWMHLVLCNVGVVGAASLLGYAGYQAGYMQCVIPLATQGEPNIGAIQNFLSSFTEPIGVVVLVSNGRAHRNPARCCYLGRQRSLNRLPANLVCSCPRCSPKRGQGNKMQRRGKAKKHR